MTALPPFDLHGGPSGRDDDARVRIDFSVSLNAFGPAPEVLAAIRAAPIDTYPDPSSRAARERAAARWRCALNTLSFGAGTSELLYAIATALLRLGDAVVIAEPTFGEYRRSVELRRAAVIGVPSLGETLQLDVDGVIAAIRRVRARLTYICSPNNPTGEIVDTAALHAIADACACVGGMLVLDQSYDAFTSRPINGPALLDHSHVIHLRSITKDHALAGVRAGFAIGPAPVIQAIELVRAPWSASSIAQAAACAALSDAGDAHLARTIPRLRGEAARLDAAFARLRLAVVPSDTHYRMANVGDAARAAERLLRDHGMRVRDCASFGQPFHIRVAARTPDDTTALITAIETVVTCV